MKILCEMFELWVRWNWLRQIEKECNKLMKYRDLYIRQRYVYYALYNEYAEKYGGPLIGKDTE